MAPPPLPRLRFCFAIFVAAMQDDIESTVLAFIKQFNITKNVDTKWSNGSLALPRAPSAYDIFRSDTK